MVSIYNKYAEMKSQKENVYPVSEIEKAKDIVRLEIRCKKGKVRDLMKKYNIEDISQFMKKADKIGNELFHYYLVKMFNNGYICTLKTAFERIAMSEYSQKTMEKLKTFISLCNESRSAKKAIDTYKKAYGKENTEYLITLLNNIELNYVTVPKKEVKVFDNGYIPTPLDLYEEFC